MSPARMDLQKSIYQHLCSQERNREITLDKTVEFTEDYESYQNCIKDIQERLKVKLQSGKCSNLLVQQLAMHRCNIGERFGEKNEFYNSSEICDLIESLEQGNGIEDSFTGDILNGFLKVHHGTYSSLGYSIVRNIKEFWFKKKKIKNKLIGDYEKIVNEYGEDNLAAIMNAMHTKAMREKAKSGELKGEWIIYKKYNGRNYYLCLAAHKEGDRFIYQNKILNCLNEFPELK